MLVTRNCGWRVTSDQISHCHSDGRTASELPSKDAPLGEWAISMRGAEIIMRLSEPPPVALIQMIAFRLADSTDFILMMAVARVLLTLPRRLPRPRYQRITSGCAKPGHLCLNRSVEIAMSLNADTSRHSPNR